MNNPPEFYNAKTTAYLLGITPNALYIAVNRRRKHIPTPHKFGRALRFRREDVIAAIKPV